MSAGEAAHAGLNLGETDRETDADAGSALFGFWMFLMTDAVIFALLAGAGAGAAASCAMAAVVNNIPSTAGIAHLLK